MDSLISEAPSNESAAEVSTDVAETQVENQGQESLIDTKEESQEEARLLAGKFKDVAALEKGYQEAMKIVTKKNPEAPENYDFDFSEYESLKDLNLDLSDDPEFQAMIPVFKELNITQDQANKIVSMALQTRITETQADLDAERAKLGSEADNIIKSVKGFYHNSLTPEEQEAANPLTYSAEGLKLLNKFATLGASSSSSMPDSTNAAPMQTSAELFQEAANYRNENPGMQNGDPAARAKYEAMMDKAVKVQTIEESQSQA